MKKNILLGIASVAVALVSFSSCIDETEPYGSSLTKTQALESAAGAKGAVMGLPAYANSCWDDERHYCFGYPSFMHIRDLMSGDWAKNTSSYNHFSYWECNQYQGQDYVFSQYMWYFYWEFVNAANVAIASVDPANPATTETQLGYLGSSYAYRAMLYLDLGRMYEYLPVADNVTSPITQEGNDVTGYTVPIVTETTDFDAARNNPRVTHEKLSEFIHSDLKKAEKYVQYLSDTELHSLPDLSCVYGLEARLFMWDAKYDSAQVYARKAIDAAAANGVVPMTREQCLNTKTGFNDASVWMWGISPSPTDRVVTSGIINWASWGCSETTFGYCGTSTGLFNVIDKALYDKINDKDFRKLMYKAPEGSSLANKVEFINPAMATYDDADPNYCPPYTAVKFRPGQGDAENYTTGACGAYPLMRVEEMYLIEAEAAAHQDPTLGKSLLENFMKKYRFSAYMFDGTTAEQVVDEIFLQKRIEFCGEGLIMFDIKRLDKSVIRGYEGTNHYETARLNTNGRPAYFNYVIIITEGNNNKALKGWNNPDPTDCYKPWAGK